jgi:hypothetical protein
VQRSKRRSDATAVAPTPQRHQAAKQKRKCRVSRGRIELGRCCDGAAQSLPPKGVEAAILGGCSDIEKVSLVTQERGFAKAAGSGGVKFARFTSLMPGTGGIKAAFCSLLARVISVSVSRPRISIDEVQVMPRQLGLAGIELERVHGRRVC